MKIILTFLLTLGGIAIGLMVVALTGIYNVSMWNHDSPFVNGFLKTASTRSIKHHASGIIVPDFDNPARIQDGFEHYNAMCVGCHGAPGKPAHAMSKGVWPEPADLTQTANNWTPSQLFWIIKNGIKFTAMPAWGVTHNDNEIWEMTAFVQKLPRLSPADYHQMETNLPPSESHHHHED